MCFRPQVGVWVQPDPGPQIRLNGFSGICLVGGGPAKGRVRPAAVVVGDPPRQPHLKLAAGLEGVDVDALVFQRPPQALDKHIVHPTPFSIHRDLDVGAGQHLDEARTVELAALVSVEDFRLAVLCQRFLQGLDTEVCFHRVGQAP